MPSPLAVSVSEYAGTQREFPAEIFSWLMRKYLNQIHSFQKLASLNAKCCDFARRADFHDEAAVLYFARHAGVRLCEIKICTVPVHGFPRQSSIGACQKLGRMCCIPPGRSAIQNQVGVLLGSVGCRVEENSWRALHE